MRDSQPARRRAASSQSRRKQEKPAQASKLAMFYIGMLVLAVGVCLAVFFVVLQAVANNRIGIDTPGGTGTGQHGNVDNNVATGRPDIRNITGLIVNIGTEQLSVLDIDNMDNREFAVPAAATINNRTGQDMTFSQLRVGQLVDIRYNALNDEATVIRENVRAWERRDRTNAYVNLEERTIVLGHDVFGFNDQTLVLREGELFNINRITQQDTVTLSGLGGNVWMVQVDLSHGFLQIDNADVVINGIMHIGNSEFDLDELDEDIPLAEGTHMVVVDGDNIETFRQNVTIEQGRTARLDLSDAEFRGAFLQLTVYPEDAQVFINDELQEGTGPFQVELGENVIRVTRAGFEPQEQTIDIEQPLNELQFELTEILEFVPAVIFTHPTNARLYINDQFMGYSILTTEIPVGTHTVTARIAGYTDASETITIEPGQEEAFMSLTLAAALPHQPLPTMPPLPTPTIPPIPSPSPNPGGFFILDDPL